MNRSARRKCRVAALIIANLLLIAGVIMLVFASVQMFRIPYTTAKAEALATPRSPVDRFLGCDSKSEKFAAFGSGMEKIARIRCIANQAPYVYIFIITAAFLVATAILGAVAALKPSYSSLYAFPILCAVTFTLLMLSVYVYLEAFKPLTQLVPCEGLTPQQAQMMQKARLGTCVVTPTGDRKRSAFTLFDLMLVWAIGWFVSLVGLMMLLGLIGGVSSRLLKQKEAWDDERSTPTDTPPIGPVSGPHSVHPISYPQLPSQPDLHARRYEHETELTAPRMSGGAPSASSQYYPPPPPSLPPRPSTNPFDHPIR